jgi:hypothetical protein
VLTSCTALLAVPVGLLQAEFRCPLLTDKRCMTKIHTGKQHQCLTYGPCGSVAHQRHATLHGQHTRVVQVNGCWTLSMQCKHLLAMQGTIQGSMQGTCTHPRAQGPH